MEENQENQEYDEPATFLFYVLFTDRLITYWTDGRDDPTANPTFYSWEYYGYVVHGILLASCTCNDNNWIVQK